MGHKVSATFKMDGNAINVDIGFIPDFVRLIYNLEAGTAEVIHEWWRAIANLTTEGLYGISISHAGVVTIPSDPDEGIIPYTGSKTPYVRIPEPDGDGFVVTPVTGTWTTARATNATARSATDVGTIIRPTTPNGYVYECTTAMTTGASTEPTWKTVPGEYTVDGTGGAGRWICRREDIVKKAGTGFTIGATMSTNGDQCVFTAEKHRRTGDMGDAAAGDPITF